MENASENKIMQARDCFNFLGQITVRSLFGGYGLLANGIMFAVVSEGELYLRANDQVEGLFRARGMTNLVYAKRGIPILLRYYRVDAFLWEDERTLRNFAERAYQEARTEVLSKKGPTVRLKDLPNLSASLERLLWKVGIKNAAELRLEGAKRCYLKLRAVRHSLGINVLLSLAGAISGYHYAALPLMIRVELVEWFETHISAVYETA
ncbi:MULTISPECIES: TfoX/Sxy family DNA transformation protein [Yersinia]|uniref:DNA transformation protein tfoX n=2 Tax=Yersinia bercovieri TaxID=634 RepID=A0A2G4TXS3_YERBE|nr:MULTISPECIES: TfoX/Sxy family DNA transformation protein [Yersinia]EEQ05197.1 DNA transformation protein tfoX [Yersinia bercovieri ATCC 43970]MCB5303109.1 TfoX/Sxy family DNA transformation protein [Yersinia bercovieri]MDN0102326.1 TfoX/Sxy family DNA transformation protein [Yersinia bercovieri]PHZ25858.1 DNA transformation protein tfoX [Yersinia bercovieri]QDW33056.1 TfoX/Sxy family DNA transformation protein [Yersinia sp. KBS0713]